jgi:hypothetical protein
MNLLSHYYVDHQDERSYFALGLVLPDLFKIFHSDWKLMSDGLPHIGGHHEFDAINQGVQRHFEIDAIFHTSDFFNDHYKHLNERLGRGNLEAVDKYVFFLSHVFVELMLDRMLIKHYPDIGHQFYSHLEKVEKEVIELYLKDLKFVQDKREFFAFFERFRTSRYLLDYVDNDSMIYALGRVFSRVSHASFTKADTQLLEDCIHELEDRYEDTFHVVFHELNPELKRVS